MPRPPKKGKKWLSIQIPEDVYDALTEAAESAGRSLASYTGRVLGDHAVILQVVDEPTRKLLAVLPSLPPEQQLKVLETARQQFNAASRKEK
jgi:uncharacterized protein (DUF1778 family)